MKKLVRALLLSYFILQLAVLGVFVYRHYDILRSGTPYQFDVAPYDPYDPFRGRYVALSPLLDLSQYPEDAYLLLERDTGGFASIKSWQLDRPQSGDYVQKLRLERYYMNEKLAPEADRIQRELDPQKDRLYLLVRVKSGSYVIEGLYLNGAPIEDVLTQD